MPKAESQFEKLAAEMRSSTAPGLVDAAAYVRDVLTLARGIARDLYGDQDILIDHKTVSDIGGTILACHGVEMIELPGDMRPDDDMDH